MPYVTRKQGTEWCVFNKDTGDKKGCHDTRDKALSQMRLLYGIESGSIKATKKEATDVGTIEQEVLLAGYQDTTAYVPYVAQERQLTPQEASYTPYGAAEGAGCANCQWFVGPDACLLVSGTISVTGKSSLYRPLQEASYAVVPGSLPVTVVGYNDDGPKKEGNLLGKILKDRLGAFFKGPDATPGLPSTFQVYKVKDDSGQDRLRFMAYWSNCYQDKKKDIIPTAALKEYVSWAEKEDAYPPVVLWHSLGTEFAQVDWLAESNGFAVASGLIDQGKEDVAAKLSSWPGGIGMSHGSLYAQDKDGGITAVRPWELTALPGARAGNPWGTSFMVLAGTKEDDITQLLEGMDMAFTQEKRAFLKEVGGLTDEQVTQSEARTEEFAKAMAGMGIAWKDDNPIDLASTQQAVIDLATQTKTAIEGLTTTVQALTGTVEAATKDWEGKIDAAAAAKLAAGGTVVAAPVVNAGVSGTAPAPNNPPNVYVASQSDDNHVDTSRGQGRKDGTWFREVMGWNPPAQGAQQQS